MGVIHEGAYRVDIFYACHIQINKLKIESKRGFYRTHIWSIHTATAIH